VGALFSEYVEDGFLPQVAVALNQLALAESLALAQKAGVDPAKMLQAIGAGAAGSWQISNLGPRVLARDFAPGFMVKLLQKDLRLALAAAREADLPLPGSALVHQLYASLMAYGLGEEGTQALVKVLEGISAMEVRSGG